jgi:ribonuclease D
MTNTDLPTPIFIARSAALNRLANSLLHEPVVAVDTESNSLYAYQEQVCLIQFSTPAKDFLVDPLSLKDLSPLAPIFRSNKIEKIFHAAEYDLICLKRDFDFEFTNIFDTMVASRILGFEAVGLGSLLAAEFDVHVDKRYQRANWGRRPLPSHLLSYAQLDTHYLIPLRDRLHNSLKDNALWPLALEDFSRLCHVDGHVPENHGNECWRISGAYDLKPQNAAVLREICRYRDKVARSINRPRFKVIGDKTLLAIAEACPDSLSKLELIPGMSPRQMERHSEALLKAVARGQKAKPIRPPKTPRPNDGFLDRLEVLRKWRKMTAREMGVKSDVVLPRDLMFTIAERNPNDYDDLVSIMSDVPWRMERFGDQILEAISHN